MCLPMQEMQLRSLGQKDPLEKKRQPTPVFLSRKFHGQRSLVGNSPWSHKTVRHNWVRAHIYPHTHSYYLICRELICTVKIVYSSWKKTCTILKKSKLRNVINIQIMRYVYLLWIWKMRDDNLPCLCSKALRRQVLEWITFGYWII